ncbi:hypothetical protein KCU91_g108, partial [Aureobasidium melanogenum]
LRTLEVTSRVATVVAIVGETDTCASSCGYFPAASRIDLVSELRSVKRRSCNVVLGIAERCLVSAIVGIRHTNAVEIRVAIVALVVEIAFDLINLLLGINKCGTVSARARCQRGMHDIMAGVVKSTCYLPVSTIAGRVVISTLKRALMAALVALWALPALAVVCALPALVVVCALPASEDPASEEVGWLPALEEG